MTITSQGQVSIPAKLRREFNLGKSSTVTMEATKEGILLKPSEDLLSLKGTLAGRKPKYPKATFEDYIVSQTSR